MHEKGVSLPVVKVLVMVILVGVLFQPLGHSATQQIDIYYASGFKLANPRFITANYTYTLTATSSPTKLSIHVLHSFPYLTVARPIYVSTNPPIDHATAENVDELGNRVITVRLSARIGQKLAVTILQHAIIYEYIAFDVDSARVGDYDRASPTYLKYTAPSKYIESNSPEIIAASKQIIGNETNPYLQARRIYEFVIRHMAYDASAVTPWKPATEGALYALRTGRGFCRHFSALFVALSRAAGIPAADILGIDGVQHGVNHNWAQFYLANYGWIAVGLTEKNFARLADRNPHVPLMSVNYEYWVYKSEGCEIRDAIYDTISDAAPLISDGHAIPRGADSAKIPKITLNLSPNPVSFGDTVVLTARLINVDQKPIMNETINFFLNSSDNRLTVVGSAITDNSGLATLSYKLISEVLTGKYDVVAYYPGSPLFLEGKKTATLTVLPAMVTGTVETTLMSTTELTGQVSTSLVQVTLLQTDWPYLVLALVIVAIAVVFVARSSSKFSR